VTTHNDAMATPQHSKIHYTGHNFDQWEQGMRDQCRLGAHSICARRCMAIRPWLRIDPDPGGRVTKLLGRSPPSYDDFAWETAALWKY